MSALSKLNASVISGHNENQFSLGNLNIDFSLVKFEAPAEYHALGMSLSSGRRKTAEEGSLHRTARKLSILFGPLLPKTPALLKAYGTRVSEISTEVKKHQVGSRFTAMFSDWVGVDATSIWAAATSGPSAISVHLLACMIARMFTGTESTSIWHELVEKRKDQLTKTIDDGLADDSERVAAHCEISRTQLAEWDASARAWLQTADKVMSEPQTRLLAALEELKLGVANWPTILDTVLNACKSALQGIDKLITGVALSMQTPSVLLGLTCWHIYPDILVLGSRHADPIKQRDSLVAEGGLLTIGLQRESDSDESIFWSLPLSYLRYYGDPVFAKGSIGPDHSRLSANELAYVAMGSLYENWGPLVSDNLDGCEWLKFFYSMLDQSYMEFSRKGMQDKAFEQQYDIVSKAFIPLLRGADEFLESNEQDRAYYHRLMALGRRRPRFLQALKPGIAKVPMFGLLTLDTLIWFIWDTNELVRFLRELAHRKTLDCRRCFIRYTIKSHFLEKDTFIYTTISPVITSKLPSLKRTHDGMEKSLNEPRNARWCLNSELNQFSPSLDHLQKTASDEVHLMLDSNSLNALSHCTVPITPENRLAQIRWLPWHFIDADGTIQTFSNKDADDKDRTIPPCVLLPSDVKDLLPRYFLQWPHLMQMFPISSVGGHTAHVKDSGLGGSLMRLGNILRIYKLLPSASISTRILQSKLPSMPLEVKITRRLAFAIVAYCETGLPLFDASELDRVFALSCGDSIYIWGGLLADPSEPVEEHELRRLHGNIGRSGLSLMISPLVPKLSNRDDGNWRVINHHLWDGKAEDCFKNTSLHLSFTNFQYPLAVAAFGNRDVEASLVESVVSIHDQGRWIADIDILRALFNIRRHAKQCEGSCGSELDANRVFSPHEFISVDCWEELLDPPASGIPLVRARDNWLARLALSSLCSQAGFDTIVLPRDSCLHCLEYYNHQKQDISRAPILQGNAMLYAPEDIQDSAKDTETPMLISSESPIRTPTNIFTGYLESLSSRSFGIPSSDTVRFSEGDPELPLLKIAELESGHQREVPMNVESEPVGNRFSPINEQAEASEQPVQKAVVLVL